MKRIGASLGCLVLFACLTVLSTGFSPCPAQETASSVADPAGDPGPAVDPYEDPAPDPVVTAYSVLWPIGPGSPFPWNPEIENCDWFVNPLSCALQMEAWLEDETGFPAWPGGGEGGVGGAPQICPLALSGPNSTQVGHFVAYRADSPNHAVGTFSWAAGPNATRSSQIDTSVIFSGFPTSFTKSGDKTVRVTFVPDNGGQPVMCIIPVHVDQ